MRIASAIAFLLFVFAAVVQLNDPDPGLWGAAYLVVAASAARAFFGIVSVPLSVAFAVVYGIAAWTVYPGGEGGASFDLSKFGMSSAGVEEMREAGGLVTVWWCELAVLPEGLRRGVTIETTGDRITRVEPDTEPAADAFFIFL